MIIGLVISNPDSYEQVMDETTPDVSAESTELVSCRHFTTSLFDLSRPCVKEVAVLDSFLAVICIGGEGVLADSEGNRTPVRCGQTILVPASTERVEFIPAAGGMKLLTCHM